MEVKTMVSAKDLKPTKRTVKTVQGTERLYLSPMGAKYIVVGNTAKRLGAKTKLGYSIRH